MQRNINQSENIDSFLRNKNEPKDILLEAHNLLEGQAYKALQTLLIPIEENNMLQNWSKEDLFEFKWLLAEAFFLTQENKKSFQYAEEGLDLASELSKEKQEQAHYQIAKNYCELGSFQSGLDHMLIAYNLSDKNNPNILNNIGVIYYRRKKYDEAQVWYERGLDICKDTVIESKLRIKAVLLQNISFLYYDQKDYQNSLSYSLQSLSTLPSSYTSTILQIHYELVKSYLKLDDIKNAEKHFEEATLLEKQLDSPKKTEYYLNYSTLLEVQGEFAQAEAVLLKGIDYIQENHTAWLSTAYERLKDLYKKQGMFEKALEISDNRYEVIVEQLNHDFDKQTNFLLSKVEHDTVKQEREFYRKQSLILTENLTVAQQQAQTDALTGIHNRAYFDYIAQILFDSSQKIQQPLSILMIDIDHFKQVNDTFGHLVGDEVLRTVASVMKNNLRKEDILARYGGEEFIVLLPNATEQLALVVAEKIRSSIETYDWFLIDETLNVTTSIGISESRDNLNSSISIADKRLYNAKENERNCCVATAVITT